MLKLSFIVLLLILLIGCNSDNPNIKTFEAENISFNNVFEIEHFITIPLYQKDTILSVSKLSVLGNGDIIVLDKYNTRIYLLDKQGLIKKTLCSKGQGPGEFNYISDYTTDFISNIYVISALPKVSMINIDKGFIKDFKLAFVHRYPQAIEFIGDKFLITAKKTLTDGSNKNDFRFLSYSNECYLNLYNEEFELIKSFLGPHPSLENTLGRLANSFIPFVVISHNESSILAITKEGFYRMYEFDLETNLKNIYDLKSRNFVEIDLNETKEMRFNNNKWNMGIEKIGKIIASHSYPIKLKIVSENVLIKNGMPFENIYPQFRTNFEERSYYDLIYYSSDKLIPKVENIKSDLDLVGTSGNFFIFAEAILEKSTEIKLYFCKVKDEYSKV